MSIFYDIAQGSAIWEEMHISRPTASVFKRILTPQGRPSKQWEKFALQIITERIVQRRINVFTSEPMERGKIIEEDARNWYEYVYETDVQLGGFFTTDDGKFGASPDGRIGTNGLLEIKAPLIHNVVAHYITEKPDHEHWPQLQSQLYACAPEREWVDMLVYSGEPEKVSHIVTRAYVDEPYQKLIAKELAKFNEFVEKVIERIREVSGRHALILPPQTPKRALREMLQKSLEAT